jgi:hypothetical protein
VGTDWQFWLGLVGVVAAIVIPIGIRIHTAGVTRSEKNVARLDQHIEEARKTREETNERWARLEEKVERLMQDYHLIHHWKNHGVNDRFAQERANIEGPLGLRLLRLERKVFNGSKDE